MCRRPAPWWLFHRVWHRLQMLLLANLQKWMQSVESTLNSTPVGLRAFYTVTATVPYVVSQCAVSPDRCAKIVGYWTMRVHNRRASTSVSRDESVIDSRVCHRCYLSLLPLQGMLALVELYYIVLPVWLVISDSVIKNSNFLFLKSD